MRSMANAGQMHIHSVHPTPFTPVETNSHIPPCDHVFDPLDRPEACERSRGHYQGSQPAVRQSLSKVLP